MQRLAELGGARHPGAGFPGSLPGVLEEVLEQNPPTFIPGIRPLLEQLDRAGVPAAIVTNATSEVARYTAVLAPDNLFRVIIGDEEVAQGVKAKPDPDAYLEAARASAWTPRTAWCFRGTPPRQPPRERPPASPRWRVGVQQVPEGPWAWCTSPSTRTLTLEFRALRLAPRPGRADGPGPRLDGWAPAPRRH
ncbi:HAD hydrolase-like protein [Kocuria rhizophila]|nr:HAD hydrolase-like protein [Kocuria rhizophila]